MKIIVLNKEYLFKFYLENAHVYCGNFRSYVLQIVNCYSVGFQN